MSKISKKEAIALTLKGVAMGAANVIPGVSGGTIALITGVFERLINALKSFNKKAINLLLKGEFKAFLAHIDFYFLLALFAGVFIAIITFARLFKYLFEHYPIYLWSFFLGLVVASVWYVAKTVTRWHWTTILSLITGTVIAGGITMLTPAESDSSFVYLLICGVVAVCSMILPGLSGSFVLILMGNYQLIMIDAVSEFNLRILVPVAIGAGLGLPLFSSFLSWLLKKYNNQTIALLTGFIAGSLSILWPWKTTVEQAFGDKMKTIGYEWHLPEVDLSLFIAIFFAILGVLTIVVTEMMADKQSKSSELNLAQDKQNS